MLFSENLTSEQKKILQAKGDQLVIAGPGTGKTFTLLNKVKALLEEGVPPEKIFILTFSFKTSQELKERFSKKGITGVTIDTFHGLAYDLYRDIFGREPEILSEREKERLLKRLFLKEKNPLKKPENKKRFWEYLEKVGYLDFDLLLIKASSFLSTEKINRFKGAYLLIDEFQDLSPEILEFLRPLSEATWVLFGDPNQSIYGFRGVDLAKIANFLKEVKPELRVFHLTQSFRCKEEILRVANQFRVSPWEVPDFKAFKNGGLVEGFFFEDPFEERDFVIRLLYNLLGGTGLENVKTFGFSPSQIFILSRIKKVYEPLIEALQKEGLPVGLPEEEATRLKEELEAFAEKIKSLKVPFEKAVAEVSPTLKNLLTNWLKIFSEDREKFLFYLQNLNLQDLIFPKLEGINLLTIHASKGLEAEAVILYGAEEGLIPFTLFEDYNLEEEKRVLYVGLTRAKSYFYFIATQGRKIFNFTLSKGISSFLKNLPYREYKKKPIKPKQRGLF